MTRPRFLPQTADLTREAATRTEPIDIGAGQAPGPDDVLEERAEPFEHESTVPPLSVEVHGVVHTVPNPARQTVPTQILVGTKPIKIVNGSETRRAVQIQNFGTDPAHVVINTHPPADMTDGGLVMANGGVVGLDDKSDWWALAAADGQRLSLFATFEDGGADR